MNKTIRRIAPVALVLIGLATLSFMADYGVTLRLKPQQGKTYTITNKANMMMNMEVQGQSMMQTQIMETRQTFIAKSVTNKESVIETQIDAIKMTISQMGMKLEYDSEHPEKTSPMLAGQTKEMENVINKIETAKYDDLGNIIESFDIEMNQLGSVIIELPANELYEGSSWTTIKKQSVSGTKINVKMTYTVASITKKSIDVNIKGVVAGSNEISGTYTGTASINPQTSIINNSSIKSNISMTISEQGLSIPVNLVGTTTVSVKESLSPSIASQLPKEEPNNQVEGLGSTALEQTIIRWDVQSRPQGADIFWRVVSTTPEVKSTNNKYLQTTPYEATKALDIKGLTYQTAGNVRIIIRCEKDGYMPQEKEYNVRMVLDQEEISAFFKLVKEE